jgi:hypothetical protein
VPPTATPTATPTQSATSPPTHTTTATPAPTAPPTGTATPVTPTQPPTPTATLIQGVTNVRALHNPNSPAYDRGCLSCHADVLNEQSLDPAVGGIHPVMVPVLGDISNATCIRCHTSVDFDSGSAGDIRRNVGVDKCTLCHRTAILGKQYYERND